MKISTPLEFGEIGAVSHRVVMAPLTRMRSPHGHANNLNARYYEQRSATGGLIVAEACNISESARGHPNTPSIRDKDDMRAWRRVTSAVHKHPNAKIVLQLWHVGRTSLPQYQPSGELPPAPSAIKCEGQAQLPDGSAMVDRVTPRAVSRHEIAEIIEDYGRAAELAMEAGFDGVELHAANGYLVDQFLNSSTNVRTDEFGSSVSGRCEFLRRCLLRLNNVAPGRVGVRFSPWGRFNSMFDENPLETMKHAMRICAEIGVAYVHIINPRIFGVRRYSHSAKKVESATRQVQPDDPTRTDENVRLLYTTVRETLDQCTSAGYIPVIAAGGFSCREATKSVEADAVDAVAFGRFFIANPDLPLRIARTQKLNQYDRGTFYGGDETGYTDYPFHIDNEDAFDRLSGETKQVTNLAPPADDSKFNVHDDLSSTSSSASRGN
ncbi:MAG: hypothetical protein MHM6MM_000274 [Cercozoa sp. M6MM]